MRIGVIAKAKQGDLMEALDKRGWTQKKAADFLGMDQSVFGTLINLKWVPEEFSPELTCKLYELTSKTPEELFPDWARQKDFLAMTKVSRKMMEVTTTMLQNAGVLGLLPGPEEAFSKQDVMDVVAGALHTLSPFEEQVVRRHVMEEEDLENIGKDFGVTRERIRQICARGLQKLRRPEQANKLRGYMNELR